MPAPARIAAFAAAWGRPDAFSRVFSTIGTYVGLRGGNDLPTLVRKTEPKPLRVFLQDGSNDLNNHGGHWFLANQEMLAAFQFAGYDVQHAWGDGAHDSKHGACHPSRRAAVALARLSCTRSRRRATRSSP